MDELHQIATKQFPYTPYPFQTTAMRKILDAAVLGIDAVIHLPTGSGKTLIACVPLISLMQEVKNSTNLAVTASLPKSFNIIYVTRTVQQLEQVMCEVQKLKINDLRMSMLASREQFCTNQKYEQSKASGFRIPDIEDYCKKLLKCAVPRQCTEPRKKDGLPVTVDGNTFGQVHVPKMNNIKKPCPMLRDVTENENVYRRFSHNQRRFWTLAEARNFALKTSSCAYYGTIHLAQNADINFTTYNNITDIGSFSKSRYAVAHENSDDRTTVLVFDEGHNILKQCCDAASLKSKLGDLRKYAIEMTEVCEYVENDILLCTATKELRNKFEKITNVFLKLSRQCGFRTTCKPNFHRATKYAGNKFVQIPK